MEKIESFVPEVNFQLLNRDERKKGLNPTQRGLIDAEFPKRSLRSVVRLCFQVDFISITGTIHETSAKRRIQQSRLDIFYTHEHDTDYVTAITDIRKTYEKSVVLLS
jgi:hypothetical protein